jgi:hypothetical protein
MIRHVVVFEWNDDVTDDHVEAVATALAALPATIDTIRAYRFGPDAGLNQGNFDFAVSADFDDEAGYLVYRDHPAHQAFIASFLAGRITQRAAVQFRVDG